MWKRSKETNASCEERKKNCQEKLGYFVSLRQGGAIKVIEVKMVWDLLLTLEIADRRFNENDISAERISKSNLPKECNKCWRIKRVDWFGEKDEGIPITS